MSAPLAAMGALAGLLVACSGAPQTTCTPEARTALTVLYERAAINVVRSGACDAFQDVSACPEYQLVEQHMALAQKALCP